MTSTGQTCVEQAHLQQMPINIERTAGCVDITGLYASVTGTPPAAYVAVTEQMSLIHLLSPLLHFFLAAVSARWRGSYICLAVMTVLRQ